MERSGFHRIFIGFCSRIAEEERIILVSACFPELHREFFLQRVLHSVGIEPEFPELLGKHLYIMRMGMPDGDDSMPSI